MSFFGLFEPPNIKKLKDREDVPGLIKALGYKKDAEIRKQAAKALRWYGDDRAIEPLIVAVSDPDEEVRAAAAEALGEKGGSNAIDPLIAALQDKSPRVRQSASQVLVAFTSEKRVIDALLQCLHDSEGWVRAFVAQGLGKSGDPRVIEPLIACINDPTKVTGDAAKALGLLGDHRAVEPLIELLK